MGSNLKPGALLLALLLPGLLTSTGSAGEGSTTETATYKGVNPWGTAAPDCRLSPAGLGVGLGGSCFTVSEGATRFRVTVEDDIFGPGFGVINLCVDTPAASLCEFTPICNGVAEGEIPAGTTSASVVVYGPVDSTTFCWVDGITWVPTQGTITLTLEG